MKNKQSGVAIVEFALVLPMLLILTFITTEFGRALYQYNILTKSVRDAARYLSTQSPDCTTCNPVIKNTVANGIAKNLVIYGNPAGSGTPLVIGLTTALVPDPVWELKGAAPVINTVTIKVTGYTFTPLIASAFGVSFGNIAYADISATMRGAL